MITLGWLQVASHHPLDPLDHRAGVAGVVAQRGLPAVRLDVRLVDHVEAQLVAQVGEVLVVRGVGGAHRVQVVGLHEAQVGAGELARDGPAPLGIMLVVVDPVEHDRLAVDEQRAVGHLDRPEPGPECVHLDHVARRIAERDDGPVAGR
jgi:hypothetical protein